MGTEPTPEEDETVRPELAELRERKALLADEARPEAVEKRHSTGRRTARENLADLVDPDSFVEYGGFAIAAQRARREVRELLERTPADGLIAGTARINGEQFGDRAACAVLSYDYMVLAGTQGVFGHRKKDRLFELIERMRLPTVLFAEGGGGRPGDTDYPVVSALDTRAFALWARISGLAPRIAIVAGRCFAGNAVLAGSADLIVATEDIALGMGGPAMVAGGGLGEFAPEEIGPISVQSPNGVVDVRVADEAAAVDVTKRLLAYFQGPLDRWEDPDPARIREVVPESRRRAYDVHKAIDALVDVGSATYLRDEFARGMVTALARIEGRPIGIVANNPMQLAGAITSDGSDKAARFMQLCDAYGIPLLSLIDTPGMMVGPDAEATALVRHCSRLFNTGANLTVAAGGGDPPQGLRARRPGDGGRRVARAAADGRLADRRARRDGPRGCGPARPATGARRDRRSRRARAARPRGHRARARARQGAQRGDDLRARRRHRPGRLAAADRRDPDRRRGGSATGRPPAPGRHLVGPPLLVALRLQLRLKRG